MKKLLVALLSVGAVLSGLVLHQAELDLPEAEQVVLESHVVLVF